MLWGIRGKRFRILWAITTGNSASLGATLGRKGNQTQKIWNCRVRKYSIKDPWSYRSSPLGNSHSQAKLARFSDLLHNPGKHPRKYSQNVRIIWSFILSKLESCRLMADPTAPCWPHWQPLTKQCPTLVWPAWDRGHLSQPEGKAS